MLIESLGHRQLLRLLQPTTMSSIGRYSRGANEISLQSRPLLHVREFGQYSRMLDMGGAPSANSDNSLTRTVNASKNSRIQAVALDFQTLLNMNDGGKAALTVGLSSTNLAKQENRESSSPATTVAPDADRVQQLASLLNVDLGSSPKDNGTAATEVASSASASASKQWKNTLEANLKDHDPSANDIRAKYAAKLKGGLVGIELAKSEVGETLSPGDAAGHLAARKIAIMDGAMNGNNNSNNVANRWLPSQAAAQLLTLLTHRSIRIVLLPTLESKNKTTTVEGESKTMQNFKDQLPNIVIDKIISKFEDDGDISNGIEGALRSGIVDEFELDPTKVLLVSKSDPYLKAARDMGMNICRVRPKNARLGSITPHYTVQTIGEVQDVVNEINGISFNTVLNR
jgi:hypothetical protein